MTDESIWSKAQPRGISQSLPRRKTGLASNTKKSYIKSKSHCLIFYQSIVGGLYTIISEGKFTQSKSFLIDDLKEKMEYNQKQVGNIFDINREIVDRQEAKEEKERDDQSNTALTILSVLCFFSAMIDGNDYLSTLDWLIPAGVLDIILKGVFPITMIGILLYVLKKLYGRSK